MAEEEAENVDAKPKSSKLPIIIGLVIALLGLGGGYYFYSQSVSESDGETTTSNDTIEEDGKTTSVTGSNNSLKSPPEIAELGNQVLNLNDPLGARRLSLSISIEAPADVVPEIEKKTPQIKSEIIMLASIYTADQLNGLDGKMNFRDEVQIRINGVLDSHKVDQVYFTEFLVQ